MKTIFFVALSLLIFVSCRKSISSAVIGKPFELEVSQIAEFEYEDLKIELLKINDSRCPLDAVCFWQGNIIAHLAVNGTDISISSDMSVDTLGYQFNIAGIEPNRAAKSTKNYRQKDYTLTLLITK